MAAEASRLAKSTPQNAGLQEPVSLGFGRPARTRDD
jgi:hypothetical protein